MAHQRSGFFDPPYLSWIIRVIAPVPLRRTCSCSQACLGCAGRQATVIHRVSVHHAARGTAGSHVRLGNLSVGGANRCGLAERCSTPETPAARRLGHRAACPRGAMFPGDCRRSSASAATSTVRPTGATGATVAHKTSEGLLSSYGSAWL